MCIQVLWSSFHVWYNDHWLWVVNACRVSRWVIIYIQLFLFECTCLWILLVQCWEEYESLASNRDRIRVLFLSYNALTVNSHSLWWRNNIKMPRFHAFTIFSSLLSSLDILYKRKNFRDLEKTNSLPLVSTRGCVNNCSLRIFKEKPMHPLTIKHNLKLSFVFYDIWLKFSVSIQELNNCINYWVNFL